MGAVGTVPDSPSPPASASRGGSSVQPEPDAMRAPSQEGECCECGTFTVLRQDPDDPESQYCQACWDAWDDDDGEFNEAEDDGYDDTGNSEGKLEECMDCAEMRILR